MRDQRKKSYCNATRHETKHDRLRMRRARHFDEKNIYIHIFSFFLFILYVFKKHRRTRDKKSKILKHLFYGMNICKIFKEISAKSYSKFERC